MLLDEKIWLSLSQRCSVGMGSGFYASYSSSSTPNRSNYVFMGLALCTEAQSCWNKKKKFLSRTVSTKDGGAKLSKMSLYMQQ